MMTWFICITIFLFVGIAETYLKYGFKKKIFDLGPKLFQKRMNSSKFKTSISELMTKVDGVEYEILDNFNVLYYVKGKSMLRGKIMIKCSGELLIEARLNFGMFMFICSVSLAFIVASIVMISEHFDYGLFIFLLAVAILYFSYRSERANFRDIVRAIG